MITIDHQQENCYFSFMLKLGIRQPCKLAKINKCYPALDKNEKSTIKLSMLQWTGSDTLDLLIPILSKFFEISK